MAGAPKGNQNAKRAGRWRDALERALDGYETDEMKAGRALYKIAEKVVEKALSGDKESIQEIGNRLDGKPHQSMDVGHYDVPAEEMTDDELERIAATGRSRAARKKAGKEKSSRVH